jgi:hypothetical protein
VNAFHSSRAMSAPVSRPQPSPPDMRRLARLPYRDSLKLIPDSAAPGLARRRLAKALTEWSLPQFEDVASLITSELVTNSVAAMERLDWAAPPPVRLLLCGGPGVVAILTWDASVSTPVVRHTGADDESGRGLWIVAALSAEWGYYCPGQFSGKVTWAVIDTPLPRGTCRLPESRPGRPAGPSSASPGRASAGECGGGFDGWFR